MQTIDLRGVWEIIERPLHDGPDAAVAVLEQAPSLEGQVPGDVNASLVASGRLPEPLVAVNFRKFEWVQDRSWWYRKRFQVPADWRGDEEIEVSLDGLDVHADIWVNGVWIGNHISAFHPFVTNIHQQLLAGQENVLLVRVTTGRERVPISEDFPLLEAVATEAHRGYDDRGFKGRIYLRKPAYVWGWDWNPPLPTCGITGNVFIRRRDKIDIENVAMACRLSDGVANITGTVEVHYNTLVSSSWADAVLCLTDEAGRTFETEKKQVFIASGRNYIPLEIRISQPILWWPNGAGQQHRYRVEVRLEIDGKLIESTPFQYGLRQIEMENEPEHFGFRINGQSIFMKGGNWVPADALYGRITPEKVSHLVAEAADANFNCLRIWGGGRFELDAFYEACDRRGIMVWHDFMSACAPLPAHEEWFRREFLAEADYQIRRLRNRACMLLWCGNNEVSQIYPGKIFETHRDPGWQLYHRDLPQLMHDLAPGIPYWPTSPYGGVDSVHDTRIGDDHHWIVMSAESKYWSWPEYWDDPARPIFNSEYGYGGPCCLSSTRQYLGTANPDLFSEVGKEHTNTFYDIPRVNHSIAQHYCDPNGLPLETYILLGGLCQGLNYGYSMESLRANKQTLGAIHWMYNDSWGENGWSIVDYYLRRKVAYYNVKRCLAEQRLVFRRGGQAFGGKDHEVVLVALNDCPDALRLTLRTGYMTYHGDDELLTTTSWDIPARSKTILTTYPAPSGEELEKGTIVAIPVMTNVFEPVAWRHRPIKDANLPKALPIITEVVKKEASTVITVTTDRFAHAVNFNVPDDARLSDHYFDLLPGEHKVVTLQECDGLDEEMLEVRCWNS